MNKFVVYTFAVLPMLFWSLTFVWYKIVLKYLNPISIIFFRLVIASIILIVVTNFFIKQKEKLNFKDYKYIFILTLFEPFVYFLGESYGMLYVSSTIAAVIISMIPVITPIFAFKLLDERLNKFNVLGLLISFIGVVVIIVNPGSASDFTPKGILLLLLAVFGAVGYGITVKKIAGSYSSLTITKYQSIFGLFLFLPLFLILEYNDSTVKIASSVSDGTFYELFSTLLYMSFICSSIANIDLIRASSSEKPLRLNSLFSLYRSTK